MDYDSDAADYSADYCGGIDEYDPNDNIWDNRDMFEELDKFKEELKHYEENKVNKKKKRKPSSIIELNRNSLLNSIKEKLLSNRSVRVKITKKKNSYHNLYYGYTGDIVDIAEFDDGNIIVWVKLENLGNIGRKIIRVSLEHVLLIN